MAKRPALRLTVSDLQLLQQILKTCPTPPYLQDSVVDLYDRITQHLHYERQTSR